MPKKIIFLITLLLTVSYPSLFVHATTLTESIEIAKTNNRIIKAEDYKLEATKSLKSEAIAEFLPNVSVSGQYGERKSSATANGGNSGYNSNRVEELSIQQPLFDGFGSIAKYNQADYKIRSAAAQNLSKKQQIAFETTQAYLNLFRYERLFSIQKSSEDAAQEIALLAEKRKSKRFIDDSEAIKFEYEYSQVKTQRFEYETRLTQAKFAYRDLVGELHQNLQLPEIKAEKFDEKIAVEKALTTNENFRSYRLNHLAAKSEYSAQKSEFSPSLSIVGSMNKQENALYFNGRDFINRSVYLNVSVPLFQKGVEYSNLSKARNQMSAAREEVEVAKSELIKNVGQMIQEYDLNWKMSQSNQELVDLALRRVEILSKRVKAGAEDTIELLRAKIEFYEKQISLINSQTDMLISYYKIKFLLGEI